MPDLAAEWLRKSLFGAEGGGRAYMRRIRALSDRVNSPQFPALSISLTTCFTLVEERNLGVQEHIPIPVKVIW